MSRRNSVNDLDADFVYALNGGNMRDIVERLRERCGPDFGCDAEMGCCHAEAADEIERLEHMKANLHGHIKRLEDENSKLKAYVQDVVSEADHFSAENVRLRQALEEAAKELERDMMPYAASKVRASLQKDEG